MSNTTEPAAEMNLGWSSRPMALLNKVSGTMLPPGIRLAGAGIQMLSTIIIARTLGDEGSAMFFFWSAILMSFVPVATYGLEQIALRNAPRVEAEGSMSVMNYLASLRTFAAGVALAIGAVLFLYAVFEHDRSEQFALWPFLLPIALASMTINMINGEALKGLSRPILGIVAGHFVPVTLFCICCALFANQVDSRGLLTFYTGSYLVAAFAVQFGPATEFRKLFSVPKLSTVRELFREGFSVCCVNLFGAAAFILPLFILESLRPEEEVSYVTTAVRISILFSVLSTAIHSVFAPDLSRAGAKKNPGKALFRVYGKAIGISLAALSLPLLVGVFFPEFVMGIFGESFKNGSEVLRILLATKFLFLALGPVPYLLLMTNQTTLLARLGVAKLILSTALAFFLIPSLGGIGMVLALSIAFFIEDIVGLIWATKVIRKRSKQQARA